MAKPEEGRTAVVAVRDLEKRYGAVRAVRGVSFSVPAGQVVGFLGPNGAGKTTVMKILTGYLAADSGQASVCGFDVDAKPLEVKRRVGYLPENNPLYVEQRVCDFLAFAGRARGLGPADRARAIERVVPQTGLESVYRRPIGECSKGYRQRVGLAQALIHDPELLILDEPTSGLDPNQVVEIHALIRELGRRKTVILTSHVLPEVEALAERVILVAHGRKVADAPLAELLGAEGGAVRARVTVRGTDEDVARLAAAAGARLLETAPASVSGYATGLVAVDGFPAGFESISRAVHEQGLELAELAPEEDTLEARFRRLTGGEASP